MNPTSDTSLRNLLKKDLFLLLVLVSWKYDQPFTCIHIVIKIIKKLSLQDAGIVTLLVTPEFSFTHCPQTNMCGFHPGVL